MHVARNNFSPVNVARTSKNVGQMGMPGLHVYQALPIIILPHAFLFINSSGTKVIKYGTKFQQALKPSNLSKAFSIIKKLSIKYVLVRITETLLHCIKHWYCNLSGIRRLLHDNDMFFTTALLLVIRVAADFEDREVNSQSPQPN